MATIGQLPNTAAVTAVKTQAAFDAKTLTPAGQQLKAAADGAAKIPMGGDRAAAFGNTVLPILLGDAAKILGGDQTKLAVALERAVNGAGSSEPSLGLKNGEKGPAADTDYPPRAANASWDAFASALGISKEDAAAVTKLNEQIGSYPKADGKYAPAFEALSPQLQQLATNVSKSLLGENVKLSSTEQAFKANLVLNNLTWHMTNWERAGGDASRADPLARNNVFNTYSDNLTYANLRGGLPAVIDMAISDSYNAGKPGVGKAEFNQPNFKSTFTAVKAQGQAVVNRLQGDIAPGAQVMVPQKDVF
jgi:hypothetical protein